MSIEVKNILGDVNLRRKQKIPYEIFQILTLSRVIPERMYKNLENFIKLNPEYNYTFFDENDIQNYLNNNESFELLEISKNDFKQAYEKIKPGAGKADLFRLLIIYDKGGCYFDIDSTCLVPLKEIIYPDDEVVSGIGERNDFHQWALIYTQHHPFIKKTLELAVNNILQETFIKNIKSLEYLSGPPCLDLAIRTILDIDEDFIFEKGVYKINNYSFRLYTIFFDKKIVINKYSQYINDLKKLGGKRWYRDKLFN